ncbi:MAG: response regulator transcription factor [Gammaproteobacteria bacterium]|nr:response regulator transcription factor [Gammaproteobacteria bacterium]MBI5617526.1 response regulator transcription factor [Gammaproteobacteria bacterium]
MSKKVLIIDDEELFCTVLAQALGRRGYTAFTASNPQRAVDICRLECVHFVVLDLRMPEVSGLQLIPALLAVDPHLRIVVLTGYASVATAVEAIKLGAVHYLTKPADADDVIAAFARIEGDMEVEIETEPTSLERLEWEYIQRTLTECDGNISAAAKRLGLHRRTLQRKLQKRPSGMS